MVFDNGLKVLLVSDKTSDKAAAAMGKSKVILGQLYKLGPVSAALLLPSGVHMHI